MPAEPGGRLLPVLLPLLALAVLLLLLRPLQQIRLSPPIVTTVLLPVVFDPFHKAHHRQLPQVWTTVVRLLPRAAVTTQSPCAVGPNVLQRGVNAELTATSSYSVPKNVGPLRSSWCLVAAFVGRGVAVRQLYYPPLLAALWCPVVGPDTLLLVSASVRVVRVWTLFSFSPGAGRLVRA